MTAADYTKASAAAEATRTKSYGQDYRPTFVDRFGVWLSSRQIRRWLPDNRGKRIADFGCGFHAPLIRTMLDQVQSALLVDVSICPDLLAHPKVTAIEGSIPEICCSIPSQSLDVVFCISVLEHLWDPLAVLSEFHRMLAPGGICMINVPSWRGKRFLELSAFRLHLSPMEEMNDHKCYYDVQDLWPLVRRAGFQPSETRCFSHKFGLNTFAVCKASK